MYQILFLTVNYKNGDIVFKVSVVFSGKEHDDHRKTKHQEYVVICKDAKLLVSAQWALWLQKHNWFLGKKQSLKE